jgi:long-chain acyl-CoA synthetase
MPHLGSSPGLIGLREGHLEDGLLLGGFRRIGDVSTREVRPDAGDLDARLRDARVRELYKTEINRAQSGIKQYERVRNFVLDNEEFTPETGLLTPSLKIKRRAVMAKLGTEIDDLYEGKDPLLGRDE